MLDGKNHVLSLSDIIWFEFEQTLLIVSDKKSHESVEK